MRSVDKKEIVKVWFRDVFTDGNTDILKDIASADMVTHSQGNDEGYVGIEHFKNWLSWYYTSFLSANGLFMTRLKKGIKSLHAIADIAFIKADYWIFLLKINRLKKRVSSYFESRMVKLPNNGVK
ncbi:hypothetical protein A8L44_07580 [Bacillus sp. FJAT-27986]|nr:hypothetical protein [Bacillus sp. FJAT-27986]OCA86262.1 hypothetical protein A8L44_07580 [Bacillus sp. FJAT-27986]